MNANKLWSKNSATTSSLKRIEEFTVGKDPDFDLLLAPFDILGTKAHIKMLNSIGFLSPEDLTALLEELDVLLAQTKAGTFSIGEGIEDVHSQIEFHLTEKLGGAGKKIHTGRSRNDQVLLAIKLYLKSEVEAMADLAKRLFERLLTLAKLHENKLMPGYTHFQIGMPSSIGLWLSAFAESLSEDLEILLVAHSVVSKNPLGSGAGYGSSFPLDRDFTTKALGLSKMNINSIYAQMTRGKSEKTVAFAMSSLAATIGKLANDICLFTNQNFGFIKFPSELTTGSSIMPHKKNPDVFELIRAKCSRIQSTPGELTLLTHNLMTGYNRDYQLTKEVLFPAIVDLKDSLDLFAFMLEHLEVSEGILNDEKYEYLFTVEKINELMLSGQSFRDAYREVGNSIEEGRYHYRKDVLEHTHKGSIGNLCLEEIRFEFNGIYQKFYNETP